MDDQNQTSAPVHFSKGEDEVEFDMGVGSGYEKLPEAKDSAATTPVEDTAPKKRSICNGLGFPKQVYFIVGNEFCERFSYYGMKAVLVLFFTEMLLWDGNTATAIYHTFTMLCYFSPILGAMIADSFWGKYKTIFYISILYAVGNVVMALTSIPPLGAPEVPGPMIGLLLIAFGTGGIKPCVAAFGGDQFSEHQLDALQTFFSVFYFAINAGSLLSTFITPMFRADVQCFGGDCYPLAFGVPAILMVVALLLFVAGNKFYKKYPPSGNIVIEVIKCIGHALSMKRQSTEVKNHWLDYADDRYDTNLIEDIKAMLNVVVMYIPLPVFWALFDQQGSRWTLQATVMDGDLGVLGTLKPDQMQVLNPLLILLFIPVFESIIYPLFAKCHLLTRPLQRMGVGMVLACAAFVIAGFVQISIDAVETDAPTNSQSSLRFINTVPCSVNVTAPSYSTMIDYKEDYVASHYEAPGTYTLKYYIESCSLLNSTSYEMDTVLAGGTGTVVIITANNNQLTVIPFEDQLTKPDHGKALVIFVRTESSQYIDSDSLSIVGDKADYDFEFTGDITGFNAVEPGKYYLSGTNDTAMRFANGGVYTVVIQENEYNNGTDVVEYTDVEPNEISMLLQIPQYVVITMGEVMFSITGLEFSYSQAPASMKSCLQAAWLLTVAFGNLIVIIVAEAEFTDSQSVEFFLFAVMMGVVTVIFAVMSIFYKYKVQSLPTDNDAAALSESSSNYGSNMVEKSSEL